jgi:hypothetical protein
MKILILSYFKAESVTFFVIKNIPISVNTNGVTIYVKIRKYVILDVK